LRGSGGTGQVVERQLKHVAVGQLCPPCKTEAGEGKEKSMAISREEAMQGWKRNEHGGLELNREYFAVLAQKMAFEKPSASRVAQETVRSHFAGARTLELTFAKEGQQAVHMTAKTDQILKGEYNEVIDRNAAKGFHVTVSQGQKAAKQQEQSQAAGLGFGF
jgi:hypothetical protein